MDAMNHKSWSPFPSEIAALKIPIRHPSAYQECLKDGATGCHRSHPENDIPRKIRPHNQPEYVQQMCSLPKTIQRRGPCITNFFCLIKLQDIVAHIGVYSDGVVRIIDEAFAPWLSL
jgi:hypothetical protein